LIVTAQHEVAEGWVLKLPPVVDALPSSND
jgi:hypothetical protein